MTLRLGEFRRGLLLLCLLAPALAPAFLHADPAGGSMPHQEVVSYALVEIGVDYNSGQISVSPESALIYLQWDPEQQDPLKPVQARFKVEGLRPDHVLYIAPKPGTVDGVFPIPDAFQGRPAYRIDGAHNSIQTGEVVRLPNLVRDRGYLEPVAPGEAYSESWTYDVIVVDSEGHVVLEVDPEIIIAGHPPCC
ncbi:MAG: hypothetical protein KDD47_04865 [Acidobacteria bacterium]|nr:hypothetical protein [Acidobacteriota bacterium]